MTGESGVSPSIEAALQHHQAGRLAQAEAIYRQILGSEPRNFEALHLLGVLSHQLGKYELARTLIGQALEQDPGSAVAHNNLGEVLRAMGSPEAERSYRRALALNPSYAEPYLNLARLLRKDGRSEDAAANYSRGLSLKPDDAGGHFELANLLYAQGRLDDAAASYERTLALAPHNAAAHLNRGVVYHQQGALGEAIAAYRRALEINPQYAEAHNSLGVALNEQGKVDQAIESFLRAVDFKADYKEAHNHLGLALHDARRVEEAVESYLRALSIDPNYAEAHNNLALVYRHQDKLEDALLSYRRALGVRPDYADAHFNVGNLLVQQGGLDEAKSHYLQTLSLKPRYAKAHANLGVVLQRQGLLSEAVGSYRMALALKPDYPEAYNNLGVALHEQGDTAEATRCYEQALLLNPEYVDAYFNLAVTFQEGGQWQAAVSTYLKVLARNPKRAEAHNNLGLALRELGRRRDALARFVAAISIKPDYVEALNNLGNTLKDEGKLDEALLTYRQALAIKPDYADVHTNIIFLLDLSEKFTAIDQQQERRSWHARHARKFAPASVAHTNSPDPHRKLRIGYVSADFRRHSAYNAFAPVLVKHDRAAFEVICYSGVKVEDAATARLRTEVEGWRSTLRVPDDKLVDQIRADGIDILVDLAGHSAGNRLLVFARKPAPVQITAWGHATGTGLETMDYLFADPVLIPPEERSHYAEQLVDLPCFLCYEPPSYFPEVSPLPASRGTGLTFGCLNRVEKITDAMMALWSRILGAIPGSRLLVKDRALDESTRPMLLERLNSAGIHSDRVSLVGSTSHRAHLETYQEIDIALDPYPQGGGISTLEAIWMGVPVVTLKGQTVPSRASAATLTALGLEDWIAGSTDEYFEIAVRAARNLASTAALRRELRTRAATSVIGDTDRYTRAVEDAYRRVWRQWCESQGGRASNS